MYRSRSRSSAGDSHNDTCGILTLTIKIKYMCCIFVSLPLDRYYQRIFLWLFKSLKNPIFVVNLHLFVFILQISVDI